MSVSNGERLVTKQDLADFYNNILPYMGGIVTSKAGFTPIGTIISVMGTTAPINYLACDGTVYNINDYIELANYFNEQFGSKNFFGGDGNTTFAVPDLRGEFLRGTGTNSHTNQGSGASVGVHQDGTGVVQGIINKSGALYNAGTSSTHFSCSDVDSRLSPSYRNGTDIYHKSNHETTTYNDSVGLFTTRPTNTSVLYCIATKNFYIDPTLDYSTDEKVVGTWIDGKPIYQKCVTINAFNATSSSQILLSDIKILVSGTGYIEFSVGQIEIIPNHTSTFWDARIYKTSDNKVTFQFNSANSDKRNIINGYAILQYTKTTD